MPQAPIIVPLIIAGVALGSQLISGKRTLSRKRLFTFCLIAGVFNVFNAFLVYQFLPPPTFTRTGPGGGFQFRAGSTSSESGFLISSFLVGFLIVLAVIGIALLYARFKGPKVEDEETKLEDEIEDEKTLES